MCRRSDKVLDKEVLFACSSDFELVDEVVKHFLEVALPLLRPVVEHEVDVPGVVDDLMSLLLKSKASISFIHADM